MITEINGKVAIVDEEDMFEVEHLNKIREELICLVNVLVDGDYRLSGLMAIICLMNPKTTKS